MRLACTLLALAAVATPALAQRPVLKQNVLQYTTADSGTVAITGVTVIDGRGGAAKKGQTVVIANGMIAEYLRAKPSRDAALSLVTLEAAA